MLVRDYQIRRPSAGLTEQPTSAETVVNQLYFLTVEDALPFSALSYAEPTAVANAKLTAAQMTRVIRVYDDVANVVETRAGEFKEP